MERAGSSFEWSKIKQDLETLQEIKLEENGKRMVVRMECIGTYGKVFQAMGVVTLLIREAWVITFAFLYLEKLQCSAKDFFTSVVP